MTAASRLLERLDGVRVSGQGRWLARCPAHQDRRASLSILEKDDSRVLINCFACCEPGDVMGALGLTLADLFDKPLGHALGPVRDRGHYHAQREALELLRNEARLLVIVSSDVAMGRAIRIADADRVAEAAGRIAASVETLYARGR